MVPSRMRAALVLPALALVFSPGQVTAEEPSAADPTGLEALATITVQNEHGSGYSRSFFRHWIDEDGDSCDTREEVLIAESTSKPQVDAYGCKVIAGDWWSAYDGVATSDPSTFDIDHTVALKEAWDSGAWQWTASEREKYANDLSDPRHLVAVSASSNRSKGDKDPSQWMPPRAAYACEYLSNWVAVKSHWGLSMDASEFGFLRKRFEGECASVTVRPWGAGASSVPPVATSTTVPGAQGGTSTSTSTSIAATSPGSAGSVTTTTVPVSSSPTQVPPKSSTVTVRPGKVCTVPGRRATYRGRRYVCSPRDAKGKRYPDGTRRWRPG